MSKVKRILSVIMAMVMVLAMSVPTFAADGKATITLKNFENANKVEYMQIIQKDETKTSGWAFTNGAGKCFTEAFGLTDSEDVQQQVIWGLIKYNDNSVKLPTGVTAVTATAAKIDLALSKVAALTGFTVATNKESIEVNAAGVYAIKAEETGFTYKTATAYVGFGKPYPTLTGAEVTAKKSPTSVDKTVADEDHVVAIGDIVTYTIEAYVPFIDAANTENRTFTITDKITGADYYLTGAGSISSVTMVGTNDQVGTIEPNAEGTGFTINLNSLVTDTSNPNAGKNFLHPGRQANIVYDGKVVGYMGEVHPEVADIYGIGERAYVAVIDMPQITELATFERKYEGIAKYPAVSRDISMVMPKSILVGQVEEVIENKGGAYLESYKLFDIYEGAQIKAGFKSVAYSITFRAKDKTLEEADISAAMNRILKALEEMGIELRK